MLGAAAMTMDPALKLDHALTESKGLDILGPNDNDLRRPGVSVKAHSRLACVPKAGAIVSLIRGV